MKTYNGALMSDGMWEFFNYTKGLSPALLDQALAKGGANGPHKVSRALNAIESFYGRRIIEYYRDHPPYSIIDLLQYDFYAVRDFIGHDGIYHEKRYRLHDWLLQHQLKMPSFLVNDGWYHITKLCDESGIEYLNRKILIFPPENQQQKLENLVTMGMIELEKDKKRILQDCLTPKQSMPEGCSTVNERFCFFKQPFTISYYRRVPITTKPEINPNCLLRVC